jgi:DNA-binding CsgD family transcriptional regulator/tetratricopeptide (TPR) repeat protein
VELLERANESRTLAGALSDAERGQGRVVLISGEAGIGKTSLVAQFQALAGDRARWLVGACDDLLTPRTLGPLRDIAHAADETLGAAVLDGAGERLYRAMIDLLASTSVPTILVIEDLQWADDATLDVVRVLARRVVTMPVVCVLTYRDEALAENRPLTRLLGGLVGSHVHRIRLRGLSPQAVTQLAGGSERRGRTVHAVTAGNPFFVTEVLAAEGTELPSTVQHAVMARLGQLSEATREILRGLAVVPTRVERWLVEQIYPEPTTALAEAERAGVVSGDRTYVWFRHELARRVLEDSLSSAERLTHNRTVLAAVIDRSVEPSRVMHHAIEAHDVEAVVANGPAAAREAARLGSHRQAADHFAEVLRHAERLRPSEAPAMRVALAYELYLVNRLEESLTCADRAIADYAEIGDLAGLGTALLIASRAAFWARGPTSAKRISQRAVETFRQLNDEAGQSTAYSDLARAHSNLASVGIVAQPSPAAVQFAERGLELAEKLGRDDLRSYALNYLGSERLALGDTSGIDDLNRALALVRSDQQTRFRVQLAGSADHGTPAPTAERTEFHVRVHVNASGACYRAGRLDDAQRHVDQGLSVAAEGEFFAGEYRLELTRNALRMSCGNWREAEAGLRVLTTRAGEPGIMRLLARAQLGRLMARRGDAQSIADLDAAVSELAGSDEIQVIGPVICARIEAGWLGGETDHLDSLAEPVLELARRQRHRVTAAEVSRYLQRADRQVEHVPDAPEPWAAGLDGDHERAAEGWAHLGERYENALELTESSDDAARRSGLRSLDRLGATATAAVVRRRLRRLGIAGIPRGPQPATRANAAELTRRQLDVLGLVVDGLTNAQIAKHLFLSTRTVDHHVAAILDKLDASSRDEAAQRATQLGLFGD